MTKKRKSKILKIKRRINEKSRKEYFLPSVREGFEDCPDDFFKKEKIKKLKKSIKPCN
jgi:hypothetical protein